MQSGPAARRSCWTDGQSPTRCRCCFLALASRAAAAAAAVEQPSARSAAAPGLIWSHWRQRVGATQPPLTPLPIHNIHIYTHTHTLCLSAKLGIFSKCPPPRRQRRHCWFGWRNRFMTFFPSLFFPRSPGPPRGGLAAMEPERSGGLQRDLQLRRSHLPRGSNDTGRFLFFFVRVSLPVLWNSGAASVASLGAAVCIPRVGPPPSSLNLKKQCFPAGKIGVHVKFRSLTISTGILLPGFVLFFPEVLWPDFPFSQKCNLSRLTHTHTQFHA